MEMGGGQLTVRGVSHVDVQTLRLTDVRSSCSTQVDQLLL
jgi:hypothetical protein